MCSYFLLALIFLFWGTCPSAKENTPHVSISAVNEKLFVHALPGDWLLLHQTGIIFSFGCHIRLAQPKLSSLCRVLLPQSVVTAFKDLINECVFYPREMKWRLSLGVVLRHHVSVAVCRNGAENDCSSFVAQLPMPLPVLGKEIHSVCKFSSDIWLFICWNRPPSFPLTNSWFWARERHHFSPLNEKSTAIVSFHCVLAKSRPSCPTLVTLWTGALQAPLSMGSCRQEHWNGVPCPPPQDLPDLGVKPVALKSPALVGGFFTTSTTWEAQISPFSFVTGYSWNRHVYACMSRN